MHREWGAAQAHQGQPGHNKIHQHAVVHSSFVARGGFTHFLVLVVVGVLLLSFFENRIRCLAATQPARPPFTSVWGVRVRKKKKNTIRKNISEAEPRARPKGSFQCCHWRVRTISK
jgi:hypothetical protein